MLHQHRLPLPRPADDDVRLPALDVEVDAAQDVLRAERLVQAADADLPALVALRERVAATGRAGAEAATSVRAVGSRLVRPQDVKGIDQEVVEHEDRDRAGDHGARRGEADLLGAAADVEALVAGGQRQRQPNTSALVPP